MNKSILSIDSKGRKMLDIAAKKAVIELGKTGLSHQKIAAMFGIGRSTVTKILLNKEAILGNTSGKLREPKRHIAKQELYELENKLIQWCISNSTESNQLGIGLNDKEIQMNSNLTCVVGNEIDKATFIAKAKELAFSFGLSDFKPTNKWFNTFKKRFNIQFRKCIEIKKETFGEKYIVTADPINLSPVERNSNSSQFSHYTIKSNIPDNFRLEELSRNDLTPVYPYNFSHPYYGVALDNPNNLATSSYFNHYPYSIPIPEYCEPSQINDSSNSSFQYNTSRKLQPDLLSNGYDIASSTSYNPLTPTSPFIFDSFF